MSSSSTFTPLRVAGIAAASVVVAVTGYAVYFDHKRRHDPVFRKKLAKQHKKVTEVKEHSDAANKMNTAVALSRAVQLANAEPVPTDVEGKEQYFMEQVGMGEQLAAKSPEFYVAAAISFFKALKVYPAPHELIMIYQKTQPQAVFELVMELVTLDVSTARAPAAAAASRDPRDGSADPLLEEVTPAPAPAAAASPASKVAESEGAPVPVEQPLEPAPTPAPAAPSSENGSSPSTADSFEHVHQETEQVLDAAEKKVEEVKEKVTEVAEDVKETVEDKLDA